MWHHTTFFAVYPKLIIRLYWRIGERLGDSLGLRKTFNLDSDPSSHGFAARPNIEVMILCFQSRRSPISVSCLPYRTACMRSSRPHHRRRSQLHIFSLICAGCVFPLMRKEPSWWRGRALIWNPTLFTNSRGSKVYIGGSVEWENEIGLNKYLALIVGEVRPFDWRLKAKLWLDLEFVGSTRHPREVVSIRCACARLCSNLLGLIIMGVELCWLDLI